ncbi:hypothetical protein OSTOST_18949 [Ostertagia ostertagi]
MIVMSIDRYSAIVHPMRRRPGKHATVAVICLIWIFSIICGIPAFLTSKANIIDSYSYIVKDEFRENRSAIFEMLCN